MASASSNKSANSRKIDYAFKRLKLNEKNVILDGMEKLAKAAMDYLIEAHQAHEMFMNHIRETDTLAWALSQDGRVLRSGCHEGGESDLPGGAEAKAQAIASGTHGWAVIILSDMEGWYREDLEVNFLVNADYGVAQDFHKFFRKV